jgi:hypothetical protein
VPKKGRDNFGVLGIDVHPDVKQGFAVFPTTRCVKGITKMTERK